MLRPIKMVISEYEHQPGTVHKSFSTVERAQKYAQEIRERTPLYITITGTPEELRHL